MTERRTVRATLEFFAALDRQLPAERTATKPSRGDFQAYELLRLVEEFATGWDQMPEVIHGRSEYRVLITNGRLVPMISVTGQLAPDGAIELIELELDLSGPWE